MPEPARSAPSFSTLSSRGPWDPPAPRHQLKSDCFLHGVVRPAWSFSKVSGTVLFVGVLISRQPSVAVVSATPVVPICAALCSSRESCLEAAVSHGQRIHFSNHDWISLQTTAIMIGSRSHSFRNQSKQQRKEPKTKSLRFGAKQVARQFVANKTGRDNACRDRLAHLCRKTLCAGQSNKACAQESRLQAQKRQGH